MKKTIKLCLFLTVLALDSLISINLYKAINDYNQNKFSNINYMSKIYYKLINKTGKLKVLNPNINKYHYIDIKDCDYYIADINYDGILDLTVSEEKTVDDISNGIIIYTYNNNSLKEIHTRGIPFSCGSESYSLAIYEGKYGMFQHRTNSADEFNYYRLSTNNEKECVLSGFHRITESFIINDEEYTHDEWWSIFRSIQNVSFYSYKDFFKMVN